MASSASFAGYPDAVEGPDTGYTPKEETNPVLRGLPLAIGAALISRSSFLQHYLWSNAGFGIIKDMPILDKITSTYNPIVKSIGGSDTMLEFEPELLTAKFTSSTGRYYSASDYHAMYKVGTTTPLKVVETLLALTKQGQSPRGTYEDAWADSYGKDHVALAAAEASTRRYAEGKSLGVLDGVPVGIKDDIDVESYVTHNGMKYDASQSFFAPRKETAWPVKKLQEAGAVVLGKNRMHEIGSDASGCNVAQGTPTNHFNKSYFPGGSTSGGSSALGAGVVPIVMGTDAGGSCRLPPAHNGVYGLKVTHSRVSSHINSTLCVICPLAANVADLTITYRLMSQPDPSNAAQRGFAVSRPPGKSTGRVLGIYRDWWRHADPRVADLCERAVDHLVKVRGYEVVDISIPHIAEARIAHGAIAVTDLALGARRRTDDPARWLDVVGPANKLLLSLASQTRGEDFVKYSALREVLMQHLAFLFQKHPGLLILTPTSPLIGWPRSPADEAYGMSDTNRSLQTMMFVWLANLTGTPSVTAPVGYVKPEQGEGKMPIGLMATGEWGSEEQLLSWAGELEEYLHETYEGGRRRPETWLDVLNVSK